MAAHAHRRHGHISIGSAVEKWDERLCAQCSDSRSALCLSVCPRSPSLEPFSSLFYDSCAMAETPPSAAVSRSATHRVAGKGQNIDGEDALVPDRQPPSSGAQPSISVCFLGARACPSASSLQLCRFRFSLLPPSTALRSALLLLCHFYIFLCVCCAVLCCQCACASCFLGNNFSHFYISISVLSAVSL